MIDKDMRQEVAHQIFYLLPTVDEALRHILLQLDELRIEDSRALFGDTAVAISTIAMQMVLAGLHDDPHLVERLAEVRKLVGRTIDAYESDQLVQIRQLVKEGLLPAFAAWREALEGVIAPQVLS